MLSWSLMRPRPICGTDEHTRKQICEQQRLPGPVADERKRCRNGDADADTGQKIDVFQENDAPIDLVRVGPDCPYGRATGCPS
jgi:hypothetical protein